VTITLSTECSEYNTHTRGTIKRMRRHGRDYDIVLDQYTKASRHPVPFGLLVRSHKTDRFIWYCRKRVHIPEYKMLPTHSFYEEFDAYTSDYNLFDEYLDYLIKKLPKRKKSEYVLIKEFYRKNI